MSRRVLSGTMLMGMYGENVPHQSCLTLAFPHMAPVEITKSGELALEVEFDLADGAVALLGDEDFGDVSNVVKTLFPAVPLFNEVVVFFIRALHGF